MNDKVYRGYPRMSTKNWFKVRERFKRSFPKVVTSESLVSYIELKSLHSINCNVIVPLKQMGILDEAGIPTEMAKKWRIDSEYSNVCKEILRNTYPDELLELLYKANDPRKEVEMWFMNKGYGKDTARAMTKVVLLLNDGDFNSGRFLKKKEATVTANPTRTKNEEKRRTKKSPLWESSQADHIEGPPIHIDLQIHISPEMSAEQIDMIFESIAKHLQNTDY